MALSIEGLVKKAAHALSLLFSTSTFLRLDRTQNQQWISSCGLMAMVICYSYFRSLWACVSISFSFFVHPTMCLKGTFLIMFPFSIASHPRFKVPSSMYSINHINYFLQQQKSLKGGNIVNKRQGEYARVVWEAMNKKNHIIKHLKVVSDLPEVNQKDIDH